MNRNILIFSITTSPLVRQPGQVRSIRRMNIDTLSVSVSGCNITTYLSLLCWDTVRFTIVPEPAMMETRALSESDQAVLLLHTVNAEQPPSVQFTLLPRVLPGVDDIREQVLVAFLAVEFLPSWQWWTGDGQEESSEIDQAVEHFLLWMHETDEADLYGKQSR